jgi:methylated-DNA-[protein]-cysteine S-methyltransferase
MEKAYYYDTELGRILISEDNEGITGLSLVSEPEETAGEMEQCVTPDGKAYEICETKLVREAAVQLAEYLDGNRKTFSIRLHPTGTPFQLRVWEALQEIPYGETRSYGEIACKVGNQKAARAVGMANHNNPIMIFIPCHRVIGANGSLVGFGGGLDLKEKLLTLEKHNG